jgi:hypothetical protein
MENWQVKPGHNSNSGVKNFMPVPDEKKYTERITILFTKGQLNLIKEYCKTNEVYYGHLFREAILEYFQKRNVDLATTDKEEDPRQPKLF